MLCFWAVDEDSGIGTKEIYIYKLGHHEALAE